jgi:hypothetical protein
MTLSRIPATAGTELRRWRESMIEEAVAISQITAEPRNDLILMHERRGLLLVPFGTGADNDTVTLSVYGVRDVVAAGGGGRQSIAEKLYDLAVTLGTVVGAGGAVGADERLAKTIVVTKANYGTDVEAFSGPEAIVMRGDGYQAIMIPDMANHVGVAIGVADIGGSGEATGVNLLALPMT